MYGHSNSRLMLFSALSLTVGLAIALRVGADESVEPPSTPPKSEALRKPEAPADSKPGTPPKTKPKPAKSIDALLADLDSPDFEVREDATRAIWLIGPRVENKLVEALKSADLESRTRIRAVLSRFRLGIFPDTPSNIVALIYQFHDGDRSTKLRTVNLLSQKKAYGTLARLVSREKDPKLKAELAKAFSRDTDIAITSLIAQSKNEEAERLLRLLAKFDTDGQAVRNLATFLDLQGLADKTIDKLAEQLPTETDSDAYRLRAHLLKLRGDLTEAHELAEEVGDSALLADIDFRQEAWEQLADEVRIPGDAGVERLGFQLAFHQLAGDEDAVSNDMKELLEYAKLNRTRAYYCGEALMICGRWDEAENLFSQFDETRQQHFKLLAFRHKFDEAFQRIGLEEPTKAVAWFEQRIAPPKDGPDSSKLKLERARTAFPEAILAAKTLYQRGERDTCQALIDRLEPEAKSLGSSFTRQLFELVYELGQTEEAVKRAVIALELTSNDSSVFYKLFKSDSSEARTIWRWLIGKDRRDDAIRQRRFGDLLRLLKHPLSDGVPMTRPVDILLDDYVESFKNGSVSLAVNGYQAAVHICQQNKLNEKTIELSKAWAAKSQTPTPRLALGKALVQEERWAEARDAFLDAWKISKTQPLPLYLAGHAMTHVKGEEAKGQDMMNLAHFMPLANTGVRRTFAEALKDTYGLSDAAQKEWETIHRVGSFHEWEGAQAWAVSRASRNIANALGDTNQLKAADYWRNWMLFLLKTNSGFSEIRYYPSIFAQIDRTRAIGLLKAGEADKAVAAIQRAQRAAPFDTRLVLAVWEPLRKAGKEQFADELFDQVAESNRRVMKSFPKSALEPNNLAWMMALCDKDLKVALGLSQRAVELRPDSDAYLDTLAEVHFRLGNVKEAIRFCKKALEIDPDDKHHLEQLARFEGSAKQ